MNLQSIPSVSVLIDTYNHERFIERAIISVLKQDFPLDQVEILVVDDGSTDHTPEIVRRFEPRLRLIRKQNGGQASAFNTGLRECHGEIVAFLDGDDWWAPTKLRCVVEAMKQDPNVGIVGHGIINVLRNGDYVAETLAEGFRFQANTIEGARMLRVRGAFLGTSRMTIRARTLQHIGPVPESVVVQADEYLYTLAAVLAGAAILPQTLTYYRHHEANAFQLALNNPGLLRRKQRALASLWSVLYRKLEDFGIPTNIASLIVVFIETSSEQLRLSLDGGWPWETFKIEQRAYKIAYPNASRQHRIFKTVTLIPALLLPPRIYYGIRQSIARNNLYQRARKRWLPFVQMPHLRREHLATPPRDD